MWRESSDDLWFAGCRLDRRAQQLWRDGQPVSLRPRTWSLLQELLARPGELVATSTLVDALWPGVAVTPKALTNRISELRQALGDTSDPPRIIQTEPRRGYRLAVLPTTTPPAAPVPPKPFGRANVPESPSAWRALDRHLAIAQTGQRQLVLIGGAPGLGKTWLLDRFAATLPAAQVLVGRGACLDQSSARESFGPWLALLADLCDGPQADAVVPLLRRCAPSWLLQLPWLQQPGDAAAMQADRVGTAVGRMLREGCALLEALARVQPLVLLLDDLHWADPASIDLLHHLAQGRAPVPLLVVATWRPADAQLHGHPLAALVSVDGQAASPLQVLTLQPLDDAGSAELLQAQGLDAAQAARLLPQVQGLAQGNPLVVLAALQHLRSADGPGVAPQPVHAAVACAADGLPATLVPGALRQVVAARLAALPAAECALLQAASVVGHQFTPTLLAAALQADAAPLAQACQALAARRLFIRSQPDAAEPWRHAFVHDAYRQALADTLPLPERQAMHGRVARCIEQAAGADLPKVAPTLAAAYVRAAMPADAARLLECTAGVSLGRFDHQGAVQALQAALQQLALLPDGETVRRHRLRLQLNCGNLLQALRVGHPDAAAAYSAADALAQGLGDSHGRVRALLGLTLSLVLQHHPRQALATAADLVQLAEAAQPSLAAAAHTYAGIAALAHGQFDAARRHSELALGLPAEPGVPVYVDLPSLGRLNLGMTLVEMGDAPAGLQHIAASLARSRDRGLPHDLMQALYWAAEAHRMAGQAASAGPFYQEALAHADRLAVHGFALAASFGLLACGPAAPERGAAMAALLDQRAAIGECWNPSGFALALAQACRADGDLAGCRRAVSKGLSLQGGDRGTRHQAALLRLAAQVAVSDTASA